MEENDSWRSLFESDFRSSVGRVGSAHDASLEVRSERSFLVSMDIESLDQLGPLVVDLAERYSADVLDARSGDILAPPYGRVGWAALAAKARRQHEADSAALHDAMERVGTPADPHEILAAFVKSVGGERASIERILPSSIGDADLRLPHPASLPDLAGTLNALRRGQRSDRAMAAFRLGGHPASAETVSALQTAFDQDVDAYVRTAAGKSLALLGDTSVFEPLRSMLPGLSESVAPSEWVAAASNVLHALVLIALIDADRIGDAAAALEAVPHPAPPALARRISRLEALLRTSS